MSPVHGTMPCMTDTYDGRVVTPETPGFEAFVAALAPFSSPALIVQASSTADIATALRSPLPLAVRSGGHGGFVAPEGYLLLDLSGFAAIDVLDGGRVRIGTGALWGDVAQALEPHGLALTSGDTYTVGVGGLTLGGGVGWMVRQHGLAIDSLLEAEVVLVDGRVVTASADSEPELFWALRGGGGNFGVVTSFTFKAHPLGAVVAGSVSLDGNDLAASLKGWRDVMRDSPADLNVTFLTFPGSGPQLVFVYGGDDLELATRLTQPLRELPGVTGSEIAVKRYSDVLEVMEKPEGVVTMVDNNAFANDFSDSVIDSLVDAHGQFGPAVLMIRYVRGALNTIATDATAWAHRDAEVLLISAAFLEQPNEKEDARIRDLWAVLSDRTTGFYGNFSPRTDEHVTAQMYPPATLERLRSVKARYDPANVLSTNHNIVPT
jgi:FAD/FMN-containing dehydrogenase